MEVAQSQSKIPKWVCHKLILLELRTTDQTKDGDTTEKPELSTQDDKTIVRRTVEIKRWELPNRCGRSLKSSERLCKKLSKERTSDRTKNGDSSEKPRVRHETTKRPSLKEVK